MNIILWVILSCILSVISGLIVYLICKKKAEATKIVPNPCPFKNACSVYDPKLTKEAVERAGKLIFDNLTEEDKELIKSIRK